MRKILYWLDESWLKMKKVLHNGWNNYILQIYYYILVITMRGHIKVNENEIKTCGK